MKSTNQSYLLYKKTQEIVKITRKPVKAPARAVVVKSIKYPLSNLIQKDSQLADKHHMI